MDRIRDLASRQRASLSSLSTSLPHRKANEGKEKSTTSSKSVPSEPMQPSLSSQTTAQAQPTQAQVTSASTTEACEEKKKKKKKKRNKSGSSKKNKAAKQRASMERREADQKLFDMAEAVVNQSDGISDAGGDGLSLRLREVARDVLEANKCIERKEQEIAEINKKLKIMEENFSEVKKCLDEAQLLTSQAIEAGCVEQLRHKMEAQLHKNFASMIEEAKTSDIATWTTEKTHAYLKDLMGVHLVDEEILHSPIITQTIVSIAKQFTQQGNYDDGDAMLLFHLANDHDPKEFLSKCHDEDHEAASRYPDYHMYKHRQQMNKEAPRMGNTITNLPVQYPSSLTCEETMENPTVLTCMTLNTLPTETVKEILAKPNPETVPECVVPGCHCERLEKGDFGDWAKKLQATLARNQCWGPETDRSRLFKTIKGVAREAESIGIDVFMSFAEDNRVPVIAFTYKDVGHHLKSPEITRRLQAISEELCFCFGTCQHEGKFGYVITPTYRTVDNEVFLEMHTHVRMGMLQVIHEEVTLFVNEIWVTVANEAEQKRKDHLINILEALASEHYFERSSQILAEDGCVVEKLTKEIAYMLKNRFMKDAMLKVIEGSSQRMA